MNAAGFKVMNAFSLERPRYAESWDFEVSGSSFLQFDLSMGCSKAASPAHSVHLEFSTDCGRHWTLITPECVPPAIGCSGYTQRSVFSAPQFLHGGESPSTCPALPCRTRSHSYTDDAVVVFQMIHTRISVPRYTFVQPAKKFRGSNSDGIK